jgi:hypothetical protein
MGANDKPLPPVLVSLCLIADATENKDRLQRAGAEIRQATENLRPRPRKIVLSHE